MKHRAMLTVCCFLAAWPTLHSAAAEESQAALYTDRANLFQYQLPVGWVAHHQVVDADSVVTFSNPEYSQLMLHLSITETKRVSPRSNRRELVEVARSVLMEIRPDGQLGDWKEVVGFPMAGLWVDIFGEDNTQIERITILIDPPRRRAFVLSAVGPEELLKTHAADLEEVARGLIPTVAQG